MCEKPITAADSHDLGSAVACPCEVIDDDRRQAVCKCLEPDIGAFRSRANQASPQHIQTCASNAGALRDMVSNPLLRLFSLMVMVPPTCLPADAVRSQKCQVLDAIHGFGPRDARCVGLPVEPRQPWIDQAWATTTLGERGSRRRANCRARLIRSDAKGFPNDPSPPGKRVPEGLVARRRLRAVRREAHLVKKGMWSAGPHR